MSKNQQKKAKVAPEEAIKAFVHGHSSKFRQFPLYLLSESARHRETEDFARIFQLEAAYYLFECESPVKAAEELLAQLGPEHNYFELEVHQAVLLRRTMTSAWVTLIRDICGSIIATLRRYRVYGLAESMPRSMAAEKFLRAMQRAAIAELKANLKLSLKTKE